MHGITHHSDDPEPTGLTHLNPIKLYTGYQVIDYLREEGYTLQIYWDDLVMTVPDSCER